MLNGPHSHTSTSVGCEVGKKTGIYQCNTILKPSMVVDVVVFFSHKFTILTILINNDFYYLFSTFRQLSAAVLMINTKGRVLSAYLRSTKALTEEQGGETQTDK